MCLSPSYVFSADLGDSVPVPCGKCDACAQKRLDEWTFRLMAESQSSEVSSFVTLTYDSRFLPSRGGHPSLSKYDFQKFMKRFRKSFPFDGLRFFAAGEYGTRFARPHYHFILFGYGPDDILPHLKVAWKYGGIHCVRASAAAFRYVAKDVVKSGRHRERDQTASDPREPEFLLMSRDPGIGDEFVRRLVDLWLADDSKSFKPFVVLDGVQYPWPRFVKDKFARYSLQDFPLEHVAPTPEEIDALAKKRAKRLAKSRLRKGEF